MPDYRLERTSLSEEPSQTNYCVQSNCCKKRLAAHHNTTCYLSSEQSFFLPSLTYDWISGRERCIHTKSASIITLQAPLPWHIFQSQVKLEFGLFHQGPIRNGALIKLCCKLRAAPQDSFAPMCCLEMRRQPTHKKTCPLALQQAIHNVKLDNTWNSKLDFATFKKATNKAAKQQSWSIEKLELAQKLYAWAVLQSYTSWSLLPFLTTHIEAPIQHALLLFRLGELPSEDLAPTWKHPWPDNQCRLNGYSQESLLHLMCVCPALLPRRQKLLQTALRVLQFRSCHPQ